MSKSERAMICESIITELEHLELMCLGLCAKLKYFSNLDYEDCMYGKCKKIRSKLKKFY